MSSKFCFVPDQNLYMAHHSNVSNAKLEIRILLVDDDSTCLTVVSSSLKRCVQDSMVELTVVTFKNPVEAHATLRRQSTDYDLVITDLYMPQMNGTDLQKQIQAEFNLPVIIMSSDERESVMQRCLEEGAVFYLVKPLNPNDVKSIWQYVVASKKKYKATATSYENKISSRQTDSVSSSSSSSEKEVSPDDQEVGSAVSVNQENDGARNGKKRKKQSNEGEHRASLLPKKAKMIWTNELHARFLQAVNHLGLNQAVPKTILNFMNVPGLTRANISSHLQKYRIFLKKFTEGTADSTSENFSRRNHHSIFAEGHHLMLYKHSQQDCPEFPAGLQQIGTSLQSGYGGSHGDSTYGSLRFPGQTILTSNPFSQTMFDSLYQADRAPFGFQSSNVGTNLPSGYGVLNSLDNLKNSENAAQLYQYMPSSHGINNESLYPFGPNTHVSGIGSGTGSINNSFSVPLAMENNNNYRGIGQPTNIECASLKQIPGIGNALSDYSLMDWSHNVNESATPMGNGTISYQTTGGFSTTYDSQTGNGINQQSCLTSQQQCTIPIEQKQYDKVEVPPSDAPNSSSLDEVPATLIDDILSEDLSAVIPSMNDDVYFPNFEQGQSSTNPVNSGLNDILAIGVENEGWSDEFLNYLLADDPY